MTSSSPSIQLYESLQNKTGYYCDENSGVIQMTGRDRASFLHNFCTADVKGLESGKATEAFVLNPKGKTLAFILILANENDLHLVVQKSQLETLFEHLNKYVIVEDVKLSSELQKKVVYTSWAAENAFETQIGPSLFVTINSDGIGFAQKEWEGKTALNQEAFEMFRIENRFPIGGIDVQSENLAQEFERDQSAIPFTKGCYLGQETVARLDALGHTNRTLCLAKIETESCPDNPAELTVDEKVCGKVTSSAWSPVHQSFVVLAMIKKPHHKPGTQLFCEASRVTVLAKS